VMNIKLGDLIETAVGAVAVAIGIGLVWLLGSWAEPHLQWLPAVRDLQHHAWYSSAEPATDGAGRSLYVGTLLIFSGFVTAISVCAACAAVSYLRDLGRIVLRHQPTDMDVL
jgi:hypothetical protein